jgi:hypothetical protein
MWPPPSPVKAKPGAPVKEKQKPKREAKSLEQQPEAAS